MFSLLLYMLLFVWGDVRVCDAITTLVRKSEWLTLIYSPGLCFCPTVSSTLVISSSLLYLQFVK